MYRKKGEIMTMSVPYAAAKRTKKKAVPKPKLPERQT